MDDTFVDVTRLKSCDISREGLIAMIALLREALIPLAWEGQTRQAVRARDVLDATDFAVCEEEL